MTSKPNWLAIMLAVAATSNVFCIGTATAAESTLKIVRSEPEVGRMAEDFELEVAAENVRTPFASAKLPAKARWSSQSCEAFPAASAPRVLARSPI